MATVDIPKQAKAIIYDKPGTVSTKIVMQDVPEPGTGEVLINLYVPLEVMDYTRLSWLGETYINQTLQHAFWSLPFGLWDHDGQSQFIVFFEVKTIYHH